MASTCSVVASLDVATLPAWSRARTLLIEDAAHATTPHAGQGASLALEDAMRLGMLMQSSRELGAIIDNFESERPPRAEKIVARARRNGNNKREFSPTGAWDPRSNAQAVASAQRARNGLDVRLRSPRGVAAVTPPPQTSGRRGRQAV
jgi:2-polyprenyl-6-methoxyphenol hydroxylase-like FAD-dependent oxidoreductase